MPDFIPDRDDDMTAVADLVSNLARSIRRSTATRLGTPGLTPGRLRALRQVALAGTSIRMGELADRLGVVPRSATTVVDELTEAGLVRRLPDPDDRRATLLEPTEEGRRLLEEADEVRRQVVKEILDHLSPEELRELTILLGTALGPLDH